MEFTLYQTDETGVKTVSPLVQKILSDKKRVLILCKNQDVINEIDASLWSYGRSTFIPHTTIFDKDFDPAEQPALISDREENTNKADFLIFLGKAPNDEFIEEFSRVFHFFSEQKMSDAKKLAQKYSAKSFFKKEKGKWRESKFNG